MTKPELGFGSFNSARRTLPGMEAMNMLRKGQVQSIDKGDVRVQVERLRVVGCFLKSSRVPQSVSQLLGIA